MNVFTQLNNVANVQPDAQTDMFLGRVLLVPIEKTLLYPNRTVGCVQRTSEFDKKRVTGRFHLFATEPGKNLAQDSPVFLKQGKGELLVLLAQGTVADHIREHDGGELPVSFRLVIHPSAPSCKCHMALSVQKVLVAIFPINMKGPCSLSNLIFEEISDRFNVTHASRVVDTGERWERCERKELSTIVRSQV
jgi:hypothetical protein